MNRPLKFRAWDRKNEEWLFESDPQLLTWYGFHILGECTEFAKPKLDHWKYLEFTQYVGYEDKNDKEIYDGDIIEYGHFAFNDVETFGEEPWKSLPDHINEDDITTTIGRMEVVWDWDELKRLNKILNHNPDVIGGKIIGNKFENPDLL